MRTIGFGIVSGHHRARAAKEAGLKEIPAHVVKLTDEEASMRLITHNAQGELNSGHWRSGFMRYGSCRWLQERKVKV
jgi:ParB-like chromosome segregation protein Spo0J